MTEEAYYQQQDYQQQATEDTQNVVYFIWQGITKIPKAIFNLLWNIFWRWLK